MIKRAALALLFPFAGQALAEGILLLSPIDCDLNNTCYIQQYMDHDPSIGFSDYSCAQQSYDGHQGTDFALLSIADIDKNIVVLAAADGIVEGVRDGMSDVEYTVETADQVKDRECGNGVQIKHGQGWVTQYCHLKQGSVMVKTDQRVSAGDPLGHVGMSGRAAFPHLHLSVRKNGKTIDPFDPDGSVTCATPGDSTLWANPPVYRPGGLISIGFSDHIPEFSAVKTGTAAMTDIPADAPALVIYGFGFGIQAGDVMRLSITGPEGKVIAQDVKLEKTQSRSFRAIGKKRPWRPWPVGKYQGAVSLLRGNAVISRSETTITLR
ncbi:MAG: M23 family metallopeptidase [Sulfitobacter sp.]